MKVFLFTHVMAMSANLKHRCILCSAKNVLMLVASGDLLNYLLLYKIITKSSNIPFECRMVSVLQPYSFQLPNIKPDDFVQKKYS